MNIRTKRIYEKPARDDGYRVLVDRVWPRGVSKDDAALDAWEKDLAPSTELRKWFKHDPDKWDAFCRRYYKELDQNSDAAERIRRMAGEKRVTLLYAAKDEAHNNAVALKRYLSQT